MKKKAATQPTKKGPLIGFIGQGFVGGSYANNFEKRGFSVIRYSLEPKYIHNKEAIATCDIVFIAVPTPTTPKGFDYSIVEGALKLVGKGKIAVVKSTLLPGTTRTLAAKFPNIFVLCSPEFLSVATAQEDADNPFANTIGIPAKGKKYREAAESVHRVLPDAPFSHICTSEEAEIIKYSHNISGYTQILTFNALYDMAKQLGADWTPIQNAINADPMISNRYSNPIHKSGRGAGGLCFIKDFAAFAKLYKEHVGKKEGIEFLRAAEKKNIMLMLGTNKDINLLEGVYGKSQIEKHKKLLKKRG
jgi:nucleotide sugar dehydrogenase